MNRLKKLDLIIIIFIALITYLTWYKTLNQTFLYEGYYYFDIGQKFFYSNSTTTLTGYDNFAKFIFEILIKLFGSNIWYYQLFQMFIFFLVYLSLYFVIFKITSSRIIGFFTSFFFATNYIGSFEMWATGNYQRFVQRVPNLIPLLFSFYFLDIYLKSNQLKHLLFSFLLFAISILMAHYSSLFLPLFIIHPIISTFRKKPNSSKYFKIIVIVAIYLLITFIITANSPQKSSQSFIVFLKTDHLLEKAFFQITLLSIPQDLIGFIAQAFDKNSFKPYTETVRALTLPVFFLYILSLFIVYKRAKKLFKLHLTFLLAWILHIFIYLFIDGNKFNIFRDFGTDRHYFISSMFVSVLFATILYVLIRNKRNIWKLLALFTVLSLFINNIYHIYSNIDSTQYKSEAMKNFVYFLDKESLNFDKDSIVIIPSSFIGPSSLINRIHNQNTDYQLPIEGWQNRIPQTKKDKVFVFDYKYSDNKLFEKEYGKPIDWTDDFKNGKKINFYAK